MIEKLRRNMTHSIVKFSYTKKNGELREALGTLNSNIIEEYGGELPKGTGETPTDTFPYWDVNSGAWRCFKKDNLISAELDPMQNMFD